jgi:hypothetical protein
MLSDFELARLERIEQNKKRMLEMGITGMARDLVACASPQKVRSSTKRTRDDFVAKCDRERGDGADRRSMARQTRRNDD